MLVWVLHHLHLSLSPSNHVFSNFFSHSQSKVKLRETSAERDSDLNVLNFHILHQALCITWKCASCKFLFHSPAAMKTSFTYVTIIVGSLRLCAMHANETREKGSKETETCLDGCWITFSLAMEVKQKTISNPFSRLLWANIERRQLSGKLKGKQISLMMLRWCFLSRHVCLQLAAVHVTRFGVIHLKFSHEEASSAPKVWKKFFTWNSS